MAALLILAVYAAALAVIFFGQWRGWFDPHRVTRVLGSELRLANGTTITGVGGLGFRPGDHISFNTSDGKRVMR